MLKTSLLAAAALAAGLAFSGLTASANDFRAQGACGTGGFGNDCTQGQGYSGTNPPYCPPGQIPHVFPGGSGYRCQTLDGAFGRIVP